MANAKSKPKVIKQLPNGSAVYDNGMVRTPVARIMFVNFETPKENEDDDGNKKKSYGCATVFKKGEDLSMIKLACQRFAIAEKGEKGKRYKNPLRPQDEKVDDYEGFVEGAFFMNNSSKYKPRATGADKGEIELSEFYSGCYARLVLRPYIYERLGNKGVGLGLAAVQFIKNGERVGGGGVDPDDVFDADESAEMDAEDEYEKKPTKGKGKSKPADDEDDDEFI